MFAEKALQGRDRGSHLQMSSILQGAGRGWGLAYMHPGFLIIPPDPSLIHTLQVKNRSQAKARS